MFSKINAIPKKVNQHSNLQITKYHATNTQLAKSTSRWDVPSIGKFNNDAMVSYSKNLLDLSIKNSYDQSVITFKKALQHDCFHDVISRNKADKTVTVAFLPISTSEYKLSCGIQKFNKIHVNINLKGYKTFYITRLLFHKTMTVYDYNKWVLESQKWYQDKKLRKAIFNEIQKDLEDNSYSLLKDSDLIEPNTEFFSKELPLVKFKFTDLEL